MSTNGECSVGVRAVGDPRQLVVIVMNGHWPATVGLFTSCRVATLLCGPISRRGTHVRGHLYVLQSATVLAGI